MPLRIKILEIQKFYFTLYQPIYYYAPQGELANCKQGIEMKIFMQRSRTTPILTS